MATITQYDDEIKVKVKGGIIRAVPSSDPDYPGIWVEFIRDDDNGQNLSRPQILFEQPYDMPDGDVRALVWEDIDSEDYTKEIVFRKDNVRDFEQNMAEIIIDAYDNEKWTLTNEDRDEFNEFDLFVSFVMSYGYHADEVYDFAVKNNIYMSPDSDPTDSKDHYGSLKLNKKLIKKLEEVYNYE